MFNTTENWLAYALACRYAEYVDLYTKDRFVVQKVSKYNKSDKKLALFWRRFNNRSMSRNNSKEHNKEVLVKSRIADPCF